MNALTVLGLLFALTPAAQAAQLQVTVKDMFDLATESVVAEKTLSLDATGETKLPVLQFMQSKDKQKLMYIIETRKVDTNEYFVKVVMDFKDTSTSTPVEYQSDAVTFLLKDEASRKFNYWHGKQIIRQALYFKIIK